MRSIGRVPLNSDTPIFDSWTPTIQDDTRSDAEGQTYSNQSGTFIKIGRLVIVNGLMSVTSTGTLTGANSAVIGGLPYQGIYSGGGITVTTCSSAAITAGYNITGTVSTTEKIFGLNIWDDTIGTTALTITELSGSFTLIFHGHYFVA